MTSPLKASEAKQTDTGKQELTAYFGISKSNRDRFDLEIDAIKALLENHKVGVEVFVNKYEFTKQQEKEMMRVAFEEINKCDLLIVELSKKAIGVGVEVGYARARDKPIIYLKRESSPYSTTVGGSSDYLIEYKDIHELSMKLDKVIIHVREKMKSKLSEGV